MRLLNSIAIAAAIIATAGACLSYWQVLPYVINHATENDAFGDALMFAMGCPAINNSQVAVSPYDTYSLHHSAECIRQNGTYWDQQAHLSFDRPAPAVARQVASVEHAIEPQSYNVIFMFHMASSPDVFDAYTKYWCADLSTRPKCAALIDPKATVGDWNYSTSSTTLEPIYDRRPIDKFYIYLEVVRVEKASDHKILGYVP